MTRGLRHEVPLGSSKQEKSGKFFVAEIYHTPSYDISTKTNVHTFKMIYYYEKLVQK